MTVGNLAPWTESPMASASIMAGWSEPRLTKTYLIPACKKILISCFDMNAQMTSYLVKTFEEGKGRAILCPVSPVSSHGGLSLTRTVHTELS